MTRYDFCTNFNNLGFSVVVTDGKYGIYNFFTAEEIVPPKYEDLCILGDDLFAVKANGHWGAIKSNGSAIAPTKFAGIISFDQKHIILKQISGLIGLMSKDGCSSSKQDYVSIDNFVNGFARVKRGSYWGIIDSNLNEVIPTEYNGIVHFKDDLFFAMKGSKLYVIDTTGSVQNSLDYSSVTQIANRPFYLVTKGTLFGILDSNLKEVVPVEYDDISPYNSISKLGDDLFFHVILKGYSGIIHATKGTIIEPKYETIFSLEDEFFAVEDEFRKFALFDMDGNQLTEFKYDSLDLIGNAVYAQYSTHVCLLDKSGKEVLEPIYDTIESIGNCYIVWSNGKCGICDGNYNLVSKIIFDRVHEIIELTKIGKKIAKVTFNGVYGNFYW